MSAAFTSQVAFMEFISMYKQLYPDVTIGRIIPTSEYSDLSSDDADPWESVGLFRPSTIGLPEFSRTSSPPISNFLFCLIISLLAARLC
ncbi:hypothetical protein DPMN_121761 [Dreissena polymorpha]|uniref:Uncharacterized protein n=1 Tax=Dreissena polymorpha TaxID=45954 RepID=A0A9D4GNE3_DREPO|nr:hypothetical protein DPMN_121761 [Dreissena polymorpha]